MSRRFVILGGILAVLLSGGLVARWQALGFTTAGMTLALLVLFGIPVALWVFIGRGPVPSGRRRLPSAVWIGLGLLVPGTLAVAFGLTVGAQGSSSDISVPISSPGSPAIRTVPTPQAAQRAVEIAFPNFLPVRTWENGQGSFEIWLRRRSRPGYALQVTWIPPKVLTVQNQGLNALYVGTFGHPLPVATLRARVHVRSSLGPFLFPGYAVYVIPKQGTEVVVSRATGLLLTEESW